MMAYFFNIECLIAAILSGYLAIRSWKNYKKTTLIQFKNYALGLTFNSLALFILSLPKLILFDPFLVQIDFILVDLFFAGLLLVFFPTTVSFSERFSQFQKRIFWLIFFIIIVYLFLNIFFFSPATPLYSKGILSYWRNGNFLLHSLFWLFLCSGGIIAGVLFLSQIKPAKIKMLSWKALFIGLGFLLITLAGILFWYFKFFNPLPEILVISGVIGIGGGIFIISGAMFFKFPSEKYVKKIT